MEFFVTICLTGALFAWFFGVTVLVGVDALIVWTGGDDGVWDIGVVWWSGGGWLDVAKGAWPRIAVVIILLWVANCPLMGWNKNILKINGYVIRSGFCFQ